MYVMCMLGDCVFIYSSIRIVLEHGLPELHEETVKGSFEK